MNESSERKFLKAKVALLETEKKHLIQKVADLKKKESEATHNILYPHALTLLYQFLQKAAPIILMNKKY